MRKPAGLRWKLIFLGLFALLLLVWLLLDLPCVPRLLTGLICPGCGMSRAWLAALRLDLAEAFRYHPMFWSIPVFVLFVLFDGRIFKNVRLNNWILGILICAFFVCYIIRLIGFLGGILTI